MNRYKVIAPINFGAGVLLRLSAEQIAAREHVLRTVKADKSGGVVETIGPVQFKAGEVIGLDHDLSRAEEVMLEAAEPKPAGKAKPAAPTGTVKLTEAATLPSATGDAGSGGDGSSSGGA